MKKRKPNPIKFVIGLLFVLSSVLFMLLDKSDNTPVSVKISLAVIGIAFIATSKYRLLK